MLTEVLPQDLGSVFSFSSEISSIQVTLLQDYYFGLFYSLLQLLSYTNGSQCMMVHPRIYPLNSSAKVTHAQEKLWLGLSQASGIHDGISHSAGPKEGAFQPATDGEGSR